MNTPAEVSLASLVAAIEARARAANNLAELGFSIANDAYGLLGFRQALVFQGASEQARLMTVSGLAQLSEDSPYLVWLRRALPWVQRQLEANPGWLPMPDETTDMPADLLEGWHEWWPAGLFALPLRSRAGETLGWVCFLLDAQPDNSTAQALGQLLQTWSYCWEMLGGKPRSSWRSRWKKLSTRQRRLALVGLVVFLLFPIRQSALAPAEVIALDAMTVAAPIDGVIHTIHVRPNQPVKAGQVLFSLDDTTLRNRLQVAQKSVAVADAELSAATQKAFDSNQSKGELAMLSGRAHEKRAELAAVQAQLGRINVQAARDGMAIFGDPDDWAGRPVATGERIMQLANPAKPGILIHLPVADAISLEPGAAVKLFLTVKPLSPMSAKVTETSYQAVLSANNIASYRLRASFDDVQKDARIGLRGTAKIYGGWVCLGYYVLRRPLAALREWSGW